jgi:hypothetical protein
VITYDQVGNKNFSSDKTFTTIDEPQTPNHRPAVHNVVPNKPPLNPTIDGPKSGHINMEYRFMVQSADSDNDTIIYTFDWGDGITESSGLLPRGILYGTNHSWMKAGKYTITVIASDSKTSSSSKKTIWIDAVSVADLGYLLDVDGDGFFDSFHVDATGNETLTEMKNGVYLLDLDGDNRWDYEYNANSGTLSLIIQQLLMTEEKPTFSVLWIVGLIFVVLLGLVIMLYRRRPPKDTVRENR